MPHFSDVKLHAFRGLNNVTLNGCADINLLIGKNNSGKTTVLEGLAILCRPDDIAWWIDTVWPREIKSARTPEREVVNLLFPHHGIAATDELFAGGLKLEASFVRPVGSRRVEAQVREFKLATRDLDYFKLRRNDGSPEMVSPRVEESQTSIAAKFEVSIQLNDNYVTGRWHQFSEDGSLPYPTADARLRVPCSYVTTVAHRTESIADLVGTALIRNRREDVTKLLRGFQPTLLTFEAVPKPGQRAQIWLRDEHAGWLPLSVAGDGLRRAFHFAIAAANAGDGVLLIDEIESALHVSALREVFGFLVRECRALGVQLFATTHSLEAVDAILEEGIKGDESLLAFVLERDHPVRRVEGERLRTMREEFGFDVR